MDMVLDALQTAATFETGDVLENRSKYGVQTRGK